MLRNRALLCALEIASMPTLVAQARQQPLPDDVLDVIRIAAGCKETLDEAVKLSGRDPRFVKAAAELYVQQILLFSTADSYRILGVRSGVTREEMRTHMRWLMTWLHPDRAKANWQTVFASRVLAAWREAGNAPLAPRPPATPPTRRTALLPYHARWVQRPLHVRRRRRSWKLLPALLAIIVVFVLIAPSGWIEIGARRLAQAALSIETLLPDALGRQLPSFSRAAPDISPGQRAANRPDG